MYGLDYFLEDTLRYLFISDKVQGFKVYKIYQTQFFKKKKKVEYIFNFFDFFFSISLFKYIKALVTTLYITLSRDIFLTIYLMTFYKLDTSENKNGVGKKRKKMAKIIILEGCVLR